tara:strand:- start:727 stop:1686 length:960 start_codon:yes stop_codon:yes gene_type:complete
MKDYQIATYLELKDYKAPKNLNCIFLPMQDGKKIRLIYWKKNNEQNKSRGTVLLQQGHNEFIEKYFETIQELLDRNFDVICFDWRGQGMSDRMLVDENKQFIHSFTIHESDLNYIYQEIIQKYFPEPLIGIGHSMGGCILFNSLLENKINYKGMILSAPMLGFRGERILSWFIKFIDLFFNDTSYFIFSKPNMGLETEFKDNELTSDLDRYSRTLRLVRKQPSIRLWGVTNAWAKAAMEAIKEIRSKINKNNVKTNVLVLNNLEDKVVNPSEINKIFNKLKDSKVIEFKETKHEIFMEKDKHRKIMWKEIDNYFHKLGI